MVCNIVSANEYYSIIKDKSGYFEVQYENGDIAYYLNDKRHRIDGPAMIDIDGFTAYYQHGKKHRLEGPAIIYADGSKEYYLNDIPHRTDGPAVIHVNGTKEYYLEAKQVSKETMIELLSEKELKTFLLNDENFVIKD